ncbi:uncharacterized protein LOC112590065 [Harpegnathos saltator]|uniref:uncharacterized protein LOC112590065 n=1 Tax=Harpegnathos saltator TaxID=610380 RepID=UPI000DBED386|nr:uncharacterized protein LOC112590065 [Harpegnathos saltator]
MVITCIMFLYNSTDDASISFHIFSTDKDRRRKWLQAMNIDEAAKSARLCSNHFKVTDFTETIYGHRRRLKNTIPCIGRKTNNDDSANKAIISEEQSDIIEIEECNMEWNHAAKDKPNSLKRKSMGHEEVDVPLQHIRRLKDINVNKVSKHAEEAKFVIEGCNGNNRR